LNEPDLVGLLLKLAKQGRIRIVLDNAALHHAGKAKKAKPAAKAAGKKKAAKKKKGPPAEDRFETLFRQAAKKGAEIRRGKFARYAHDKIFIVKTGNSPDKAVRVLTGSTNFSVTGLYVNSNHVVGFNDAEVAREYANMFEEVWTDRVSAPAFRTSS